MARNCMMMRNYQEQPDQVLFIIGSVSWLKKKGGAVTGHMTSPTTPSTMQAQQLKPLDSIPSPPHLIPLVLYKRGSFSPYLFLVGSSPLHLPYCRSRLESLATDIVAQIPSYRLTPPSFFPLIFTRQPCRFVLSFSEVWRVQLY